MYSYSLGSLRNLGTFTGNQNSSSYYIKAKLSPDGSMLASGSTDDAVCLWRVDSPGAPIARLMVSSWVTQSAEGWFLRRGRDRVPPALICYREGLLC